jgi:hypothetical protein
MHFWYLHQFESQARTWEESWQLNKPWHIEEEELDVLVKNN